MELFKGDCLEKMKDLETDSIDLLFCDLPYCGITNSIKNSEIDCTWNIPVDLELFWKEANRVCKINAPMFFTCSTKFGVALINSNPKNFRFDMVWVKSSSVGFLNSKKMPLKKHEMLYVFYRKLPFYNIADNHTHKFLKESENKIKGVYAKNGCKKQICNKYYPPLPTSILEVASQKGKHPTQKPTALMEWVLKYYTRENDLVLDPTMGSGSTGVACQNMNRRFIGIEMDEKIFEDAKKRLIKEIIKI
jgi:DNA modification methylase